MSSEDAIRRADLARQIVDNPLFVESLDALDESLRRQRLAVKASDSDGHLRLIIAEQITHQFRAYLKRTIEDGKQAQMQLVQQPLMHRVFAR